MPRKTRDKPDASPLAVEDAIDATVVLEKILTTLQPLDKFDRARVLRSVMAFYEI